MNTQIPVEILSNSNVVTTVNQSSTISDFTGATEESNGARGFVPAPTTAQRNSFLRGDGAWSTSGFNVEQKVSTTDNTYPLLLSPTANATSDQGPQHSIFASGIKANPSTGILTATGFSGPLTGNVTGDCSGSSGSCTGNAGTATKLAAAKTIDGMSFDGSGNITHYVTCSTGASTAAKAASLTGFTLATGSRVFVKFSNTNTAANPTLNINSTGAKAIYINGAAVETYYLQAGCVYEFVYNGTQWDIVNGKRMVKFTSTDPGSSTTPPTDLAEGGILIYTPAS